MTEPLNPHPPEAALIALLDQEVTGPARLGLLLHLLGCGLCRERLAKLRADKRAVREALGTLSLSIRSEDAWARLSVASGLPQVSRTPARALALAATIALVAGLTWGLGRTRTPTAEFLDALETLPTRPDLEDARGRESRQDSRFIGQLLGLARTGQAQVVRDDCCEDHDGEGPADDGIFAARLPGARLALHVMYDDADGTHSLTTGDLIRSVAKSTLITAAVSPAASNTLVMSVLR